MFYNTINLTGKDLEKATAETLNQEELIKAIFKKNATTPLSPSQVLEVVNKHYGLNWLLTSCRRALCDLTKDNVLVKLPTKIDGMYGKKEHLWIYKVTVKQQQLF